MGEPTFWMKLQEFVFNMLHAVLCWMDIHAWITWGSVRVCHYCGEEIRPKINSAKGENND